MSNLNSQTEGLESINENIDKNFIYKFSRKVFVVFSFAGEEEPVRRKRKDKNK